MTFLSRHISFESMCHINQKLLTGADKIAEVLEDLLTYSLKVRYLEQHESNYPGCGQFYMLDCDQKVASRVCANSRKKGDLIQLRNSNNADKPYLVEIIS